MYQRKVRPRIDAALNDMPAVALVGARQVGKSTLARTILPDEYRTLDRALLRAAAHADPDGFVEQLPDHVVLDEVQRVPDLFLAIKAAIDQDRRPGRFLLAGSASPLLLPAVTDALPGRMEIVELHPLSQGELRDAPDRFLDLLFHPACEQLLRQGSSGPPIRRGDAVSAVARGGFPDVVERGERRRADWFDSYVTAIVERDVKDLVDLAHTTELTTIVRLGAARSGHVLNLAGFARDARLSETTTKRYLRWLEAVFLFFRVPAWSPNRTSQASKAPKLVLTDSGLAAHLAGANEARIRDDGALFGHLLEGFVHAELRRQATWADTRPRLFHFRERDRFEADVVIETPAGDVAAIEVKGASNVSNRDLQGVRRVAELAGDRFRVGVILYLGTETVGFGGRVWAVPLQMLWEGAPW